MSQFESLCEQALKRISEFLLAWGKFRIKNEEGTFEESKMETNIVITFGKTKTFKAINITELLAGEVGDPRIQFLLTSLRTV